MSGPYTRKELAFIIVQTGYELDAIDEKLNAAEQRVQSAANDVELSDAYQDRDALVQARNAVLEKINTAQGMYETAIENEEKRKGGYTSKELESMLIKIGKERDSIDKRLKKIEQRIQVARNDVELSDAFQDKQQVLQESDALTEKFNITRKLWSDL